jgi:hypothetical protein
MLPKDVHADLTAPSCIDASPVNEQFVGRFSVGRSC